MFQNWYALEKKQLKQFQNGFNLHFRAYIQEGLPSERCWRLRFGGEGGVGGLILG